MTLRTLAYQQRVLSLLDAYLDALVQQRAKAERLEQINAEQPDTALHYLPLNFPEHTWQEIQAGLPASRFNIPHSPRMDGAGRYVPNIVYKVPTAGGKTFLAMASLSRIFDAYLNKTVGFVLWIVPNEAIYSQTKKYLLDKSHPYRQILDNAAGRAKNVKIMEKTTPLSASDVTENLCVMLLMLQSSNQSNRERLKMFRERGDVTGFAPMEGEQKAHQKMKAAIPNLDLYDLAESPYPWMPIRESLGNALRVIRPVVVMDEGHRAVSDLAYKTLYGFNPSFVLELTATPKDVLAKGRNQPARHQNILADVSGRELDREGMIKMPINLDSRQVENWKTTLRTALDQLNMLAEKAENYRANKNRYIRPIMLVQVERTGDDQRDGNYIHAEDAREWLLAHGGLQEREIAIKTSQQNDLKIPENQDLLAESNLVRVIITKQALQEGWDCPFAYVLCALAANQNQAAMTQLVGRILRQPHAEKTGVSELDQCYVVTHHATTETVVGAIKNGLEKEGLGDLNALFATTSGGERVTRDISRRLDFVNSPIFLPKVLRIAAEGPRELNYETDILCRLDWRNLDISEMVNEFFPKQRIAEREQRRINLGVVDERGHVEPLPENRIFDSVHMTRYISDIVPNAWIAWDIVDRVRQGLLKDKLNREELDKFSPLIETQLRRWLELRRDKKAEEFFRNEVKENRIQFRLRTDLNNWKMPKTLKTSHPEQTQHLMHHDGALRRSLFEKNYEPDFNQEEKNIALYMDNEAMLHWWHRNAAARDHYHIQGWRRQKIYPDFICSVRKNGGKFVVLETKGEHLSGNLDSEYKREVLELMKNSFSLESVTSVGEIELLNKDGVQVVCEMVMMKDYESKLPKIFQE